MARTVRRPGALEVGLHRQNARLVDRDPPTHKGTELAPTLIVLMKWGDRHYPTPGGPPRLTLHAGCGGNIGPDLRCDRCGKHAARGEIELPPGPGAPHGEHARR